MVNTNYYGTAKRTEIDLRQEMENLLDGSNPEISKKQIAIFRKMRRDSNGDLIPCACVDDVTHEADKSAFCFACWGSGFYWDEIFIDVFRMVLLSDSRNALREVPLKPVTMSIPVYKFYVRYSEDVTDDDYIAELVLDEEGAIVKPYKRKALYRIISAIDKRSDNGRIEFWEIDTFKEEVKYLNGP